MPKYTVSYWFDGAEHEVDATLTNERLARKLGKGLAEDARYTDVTVWRGRPGEFRVETFNPTCDASRFGDACVVCAPVQS